MGEMNEKEPRREEIAEGEVYGGYRNGYEVRFATPGPEGSMAPHKASGGPSDPIPNTTGKGSNASKTPPSPDGPSGAIPGQLAPQVTQPNA